MSKNNKKNTVFLKKLICALLPGLLIETVGVVIAALFVYQTGIIYLYYLFCVFAFFAAFAASYSFQKKTAIKGLFSGLIFGTLFSIIFVGIIFVFRESLGYNTGILVFCDLLGGIIGGVVSANSKKIY